ncbi:hypothetical protein NON20_12695 [Synechocystis sp. B12]|nr:hypothetical protein NON20_12695 [Synechocystis sp. B12]
MNSPFIPIALPSSFEHTYTDVEGVNLHAIEGEAGNHYFYWGAGPKPATSGGYC